MSRTSFNEDPLVDHLERLVVREDRATLAALRRSLQPDRSLDGLRVVLPFLGRNPGRHAEDDALLVAGLFALHPESGTRTLAGALRVAANESESVELRFRALLGASREDLGNHLRHAVSLVAGRGLAIDWRALRRTVRLWDHADGFVQREWARDFWAPDAASNESDEIAS